MKAVLAQRAPAAPVVELFNDAPAFNPRAAAHLLAAYFSEFPPATIFLCVVDPGVGGSRRPVMVALRGRWLVGPDNGLFDVVAAREGGGQWWEIGWRPLRLSSTFHGRDLFAPVAAMLANGQRPEATRLGDGGVERRDGAADLAEVIYLDQFGNAMSGIRADRLSETATLVVAGRRLRKRRTFSDVARGEAFWYENANGLVEIAVNQGSAGEALGLKVGSPIRIEDGPPPSAGEA